MKNYKLRRIPFYVSVPIIAIVIFAALAFTQYGPLAARLRGAIGPKQQPQRERQMNLENPTKRESPLACNIAALNDEQRKRIQILLTQMKSAHQEVRDLPDGYAFRLPTDSATIRDTAEYVTLERLCCPFFRFDLEVEQEGGPLWLRLTGRPGVKELTKLELGL
jgi:hypothetical protein